MRISALIALLSLSAGGPGYGSPDPGDGYRLTMPTLRKVLPVLYAPGRDKCDSPGDRERDPSSWSLAELNGRLDRCAPIKAAMAKAGVQTAEAALVLYALYKATRRIVDEESAKALGKQAPALPAGVLKENVALLRQYEGELKRISEAQGEKS